MQIRRVTFGAAVVLSIWIGMAIGGPWTVNVIEGPTQSDAEVHSDGQTPKEGRNLHHHLPIGTVALRIVSDWFTAIRDNVNAVSTLTVAIFTYVLAKKTAGLDKSTRDLWKASQDQRRDTRRIARRQANDMRSSIKAARDAVRAAKRSTDAVVALEAPKIILSGIRIVGAFDSTGTASIRLGLKMPAAICEVKNYGRSPAFLHKSSCEIFLGAFLPAEPDYQNTLTLPFNTVVDSSEKFELDAARYNTLGLSDDEVIAIVNNRIPMWVYGEVAYRNFLGRLHIARFCKRFHANPNMDNVYSWWDGDAPQAYTESS